MSSITSLNNSNYYQLSDLSAGATGTTSQTDPATALLQALSGGSDTSSSSSDPAYLLNLSPEAQQYLTSGGASSTVGGTSATGNANSNFTLSAQQQDAINTILEKYKDSPDTQATFDSIQNDLQAAGLDPATLARIDQAQNFNPTALFVDDLNGDTAAANAITITNPNESAKETNYMQSIETEWQNMSGNNAGSSTTSGTSNTSGTTSSSATTATSQT